MPGRNEKCPCNSGKKFKKCCLIKINESQRKMAELERLQAMQEMRQKMTKKTVTADTRLKAVGTTASFKPNYYDGPTGFQG